MKKTIISVFVFLMLTMLVIGCSQKVSNDEILASFGKSQVIRASELDKEISELPEWKQDKYKDQSGREEYLTLMAESRMILTEAKGRKLDKDPEIVKQVKEFQDEIIRDKITKKEIDDKVKVSDLDIEKYYAENKDKYVEPEKVVVTEITLKEETKAKELLDNIKAGADFTQLAKEMDAKNESFGPGIHKEGITGPFSRDSFSAKEFVETSFNLKLGEISDIIVQPYNDETYYMIVRKDKEIPSRQQELLEVKDNIKRNIESDMKDAQRKNWINQLKKEKKVEIFTDKIPKDPESKTESEEKLTESKEDESLKIVNPDVVLTKIDEETITLNQINKNISEMPEWKQDRYKAQEDKKKYLDELIEEKLLTMSAYSQKIDKDTEIVRQVNEYRDQLMLKELVKADVDDKIKIEDADLEKYYIEHKEDYVEPEKVVVTEITLQDEMKAKEVMDKIKAGADFTKLANEMDAKGESFGPGKSNGGKTDPFSRESFSSAKQFVESVFCLKLGEMSDIIVQPRGQDTFYMIVRKDEEIPPKQQEFSEVKDDIRRSVERDKKKARIEEWLNEMKKEANFKLYLERIPKYVEKKDTSETVDNKASTS